MQLWFSQCGTRGQPRRATPPPSGHPGWLRGWRYRRLGAVGLNEAARQEGTTPTAQARIASAGWAKWTPVNAAAIAAHLYGGGGLLAVNAHRVCAQKRVAASSYARVLRKKIELASSPDPEDTEKAAKHPIDIEKVQRQLSCVQWAVPALTGYLVILNDLHGAQQRPLEQLHGMWEHARSATPLLP
ncbi:hypothetical protein [Streptomyces collinus]|uniref:hypothetical protein n=1 Tax=Streptomyces collinus TaxID=42684 RepID=UPI003678E01E